MGSIGVAENCGDALVQGGRLWWCAWWGWERSERLDAVGFGERLGEGVFGVEVGPVVAGGSDPSSDLCRGEADRAGRGRTPGVHQSLDQTCQLLVVKVRSGDVGPAAAVGLLLSGLV